MTPRTIQSMEFSRPEYWSGLPFPSPGYLPNPRIQPRSPAWQADSLPTEPQGKPTHKLNITMFCLFKGKSYQKYRKVASSASRLQNDRFLSGEASLGPETQGHPQAKGQHGSPLKDGVGPHGRWHLSLPVLALLPFLFLPLSFQFRVGGGSK